MNKQTIAWTGFIFNLVAAAYALAALAAHEKAIIFGMSGLFFAALIDWGER